MERLTYMDMLADEDRASLRAFVAAGTHPARDVRRAHVLLLSDAGRSRSEICELLGVSVTTVDRVRHRARDEGVATAITDRPRSGRPRKLTARDEARIVAVARTRPPPGRRRWAHRHLTATLREQRVLSCPVGRETVRLVLKRQRVKPWKKGRPGASRP